MARKNQTQIITRPFSHVHDTLTSLGFIEKTHKDSCVYEMTFRDSITSKRYLFRLPTQTAENGMTDVPLHEAAFTREGEIPQSAVESSERMMAEVEQYLSNHEPKRSSAPIDKVMNGRMANNEQELKRLGNEMAKMPTNSQVIENGMIPDPIQ